MIKLPARRPHGEEAGVALIAVIIAIMVISTFLLISLKYGLDSSSSARRDQDSKTATAAAQAGIDEYLSRLNATPDYYLKANVDAANPAFTGGQTIPGTGSAGGTFTYRLLTTASSTAQDGLVRLQVAGKSRNVTRTLTASLRTKGFLNQIYFSDFEVGDPALTNTSTNCGKYYYSGRSSLNGCSEIQWTGGDTVRGPLHSNDALQINGAVNFTNRVTETAWPATKNAASGTKTWWGTAAAGSLSGYTPHYADPIAMPDTNTTLAAYTTPGANGTSTGPGCYYTGATKITFAGKYMSVTSPNTSLTATPARCRPGASVLVPPVIYVDETSSTCTGVGYPATSEVASGSADTSYWTSNGSSKTTNYRCGRGTAFISGTVDTQVTVASADDIVITGDLKVADNLGGTDVIGLIADNNVWIYHPVNSSSANLLTTPVRTVQAAILSVSHSFVVQNWALGSPLGTLNVSGAIAQKFRGPVGTGSGSTIATGYYKNYVYDPRLAYLQPPYFLAPASNQWLVADVTDN
jgi:type II secretory pathway pseudopilin PulG